MPYGFKERASTYHGATVLRRCQPIDKKPIARGKPQKMSTKCGALIDHAGLRIGKTHTMAQTVQLALGTKIAECVEQVDRDLMVRFSRVVYGLFTIRDANHLLDIYLWAEEKGFGILADRSASFIRQLKGLGIVPTA